MTDMQFTFRSKTDIAGLSIEGYGNDYGTDAIIYLEKNEAGDLQLWVWADKTSEEPTHVISLRGAKL